MTAYCQNIWAYRHFWMSLVRMDLRTRYRRSVLGLGWSLLQPLATTCILAFVFSSLVKASLNTYVPHVLTGLVVWNFILGCTVHGCQCFFQGESYIRQCPLPIAIYPLRTALGAGFHLLTALGVMVGVAWFATGFAGVPALLSLLPSLVLLFVLGWSLAVIAGAANVFFQDTQHLLEVGFQLLFYLTPIIFRLEDLAAHKYGWLLQWNPVICVLALVREPLLGHVAPSWNTYGAAVGVTAAAAALATWLVRKLQDKIIFHL